MNFNIKDVKFSIVESLNPKFVEVVVNFVYENINRQHYVFITRRKDYKEKDYLKEAKEAFYNDLRNGRVNFKKKASPLLVGLASFFAVTTLALGGFLTYKLLVNPKDDPIVPTGDINLNLDEDSAGVSLFPAVADKDEDYHGTLTVENADKALLISESMITSSGQELMFGRDYSIEIKNSNNGKYEYSLSIDASVMNGDLSLHMPSGDASDFKTTSSEYTAIPTLFNNPSFKIRSVGEFLSPNDVSKSFICSSYIEDKTQVYQIKNGKVRDIILECIDPTNDFANSYSRGGESAMTNLYAYKESERASKEFIRAEDDRFCAELLSMIDALPFSGFNYNKQTLTNTCTTTVQGKEIVVYFSTYKGKPTYFKTFASGSNLYVEAYFLYNFKDVVIPDESNSFIPQEFPYVRDDDMWDELLTIDDSRNITFDEKDSSATKQGIIPCSYNGDIYAKGIQISRTVTVMEYYVHEGKNYYSITYDLSGRKWAKKEISSEDYEENSYDSFKAYIENFRNHFDDFTYDGEDGWYRCEDELSPLYDNVVSFTKITSRDGKNSEMYVDTIGKLEGTRFLNLFPHAAPKLVLPEVE